MRLAQPLVSAEAVQQWRCQSGTLVGKTAVETMHVWYLIAPLSWTLQVFLLQGRLHAQTSCV